MILIIDTTQNNLVEISIEKNSKVIARKVFKSNHTEAEKLLPIIVKLLQEKKLKLGDLTAIQAANRGGSFTSLRIGVVTANALGYALGIPARGSQKSKFKRQKFFVIKPWYGREPRITKKKTQSLAQKSQTCGKDV